MSYQIVKGWPNDGAIDVVVTAAAGVTLTGGQIAMIDSNGKAVVGTYAANGSDAGNQPVFIIDNDEVKTGNYTGLMSQCLIEVDADHYAADTYAANASLTASAGKFAKPTSAEPVIAKVVRVNAATGKMLVLWTGEITVDVPQG